jgi:hypothetical protein
VSESVGRGGSRGWGSEEIEDFDFTEYNPSKHPFYPDPMQTS